MLFFVYLGETNACTLYTHFNKTYKTASRLDFFLTDDHLSKFPVCNTKEATDIIQSIAIYPLISKEVILIKVRAIGNLITHTYKTKNL